jgi:hypothetical protein
MEEQSLATGSSGAPAQASHRFVRPTGRMGVRFRIVYTVLGLILVGSLTAFVVLGLRPGFGSSAKWSSWTPPSGHPLAVATEIADYVGPKYKFANGGQLLAVVPSAPAVTAGTQTIGIVAVATRTPTGGKQDVSQLDPGTAVMYTLCGLGNHCGIASGTPTVQRGALVRREGLEVALYTFKYIPSVNSVLIYAPPSGVSGAPVSPVLYFTRESLSGRLALPLAATLPLQPPPRVGQNDLREKPILDGLTLPHFYSSGLIQLQVGGALLALVHSG